MVRIRFPPSASQAPGWRGPWRGTTAFPDYSELMRGKASCHLISPNSGDPLSFVAVAGGMGRDGDVDGARLISVSP